MFMNSKELRRSIYGKIFAAFVILSVLVGIGTDFKIANKIFFGGLALIVFSFFQENPIAALRRMLFYTLLLLTPLVIALQGHYTLHELRGTFLFAVSVAILLEALFAFLSGWGRRACYLLETALLFFILLVYWGYYSVTGKLLPESAVFAIFQTNPEEASAYVSSFFSLTKLLLLLLIAALYVWIAKRLFTGFRGGYKRSRVISTLFFTLFSFVSIYNAGTSLYVILYKNIRIAVVEQRDFQRARENREKELLAHPIRTEGGTGGLYVLVIGEAQNRNHMSAYGYERQTTPWLDSMRSQEEMILFQDAFSSYTQTVQALQYALTEKNQYNEIRLADSITLLEAIHAAGYRILWLSNQPRWGFFDTATSIIAGAADKTYWTADSVDFHRGAYDEAIVDDFAQENTEGNTFVVIHLKGCHIGYNDRYPKSYAVEDPSDWTGAYDNAMRYNDEIVRRIYEEASERPNFRAMIFFSDHGEDVANRTGHDPSKYTQAMAEIPFYMILSPSYQSEAPARVATLRNNQKLRFTNDLIFNTVLGVMGIALPGHDEPWNDISNEKYDGNKQRFRTLYGKQNLE